jgi:hypothetical protein
MAIAYKSAGAGVSSESLAVSLSPACPAVVDANDILICHVFWEGTATAPTTPSGWTLLDGPRVIETTIARHWVFGKIADGSEDGTAVTFSTAPAVTTQRAARIYSFSGYVSGTITDIIPAASFAATSHATDPQMPTVTTTQTGALAVAVVAQNDNNAFVSPTGETGGDWVEAVAEYTAALTPGLSLGLETCTPTANPGTVTGGTISTTNDPCGVIGFQIKTQGTLSYTLSVDSGSYTKTGTAASLERGYIFPSASGSYIKTGTAANLERGYLFSAASGSYTKTGQTATLIGPVTYDAGSYVLTGSSATLIKGYRISEGIGSYSLSGQAANLFRNITFVSASGSYVLSGQAANLLIPRSITASSGNYTYTGQTARAIFDVFPSSPSTEQETVSGGGGGVRFIPIEEIDRKKSKKKLEQFLNRVFTDKEFSRILNSLVNKFSVNREMIDPMLTEDEEALLYIILMLD